MIREVQAKTVITFHDDPFPSHWDINPYRGCSIGCKYCFAQYSHQYLGLNNFFSDIVVKTNVVQCFDQELKKDKTKGQPIKVGGTTDIYQHAEKQYRLMPGLLEAAARHGTPLFLQTKSKLILRDREAISRLSRNAPVDIATSVSVADESLRKVIEPGAATTQERIEMLGAMKGNCRFTVLCIMPLIPLLSDTFENLDTLFDLAQQNQVDYVLVSFLHLRGRNQHDFKNLVQKHFPAIYPEFAQLYSSNGNLQSGYKASKYPLIHSLYARYGLSADYQAAPAHPKQLTLF